jgi:hypothetical protein
MWKNDAARRHFDPGDQDLGFAPEFPGLGDKIDCNKEARKQCLHGGYAAKSAKIV